MKSPIARQSLKQRYADATIGNKISMIIVASLVAAMVIVFIPNSWVSINNDLEGARESLQTVTNIIGQNLQGPLVFNDKKGALEVLQSLQASSNIVRAEVRNSRNEILAQYSAKRGDGSAVGLIRILPVQHRQVVSQPLAIGSQSLGSLTVEASLDTVWEAQLSLLMSRALVAAIGLMLAIYLVKKISARIVQPIQQIASMARKITGSGDYGLRVNKSSEDEVGVLADEFNSMLNTINQRDQALRESEERFRSVWESSVDGMRLATRRAESFPSTMRIARWWARQAGNWKENHSRKCIRPTKASGFFECL
ncbi:MAG: HAMP domain-containing protein [Betaproteobacteria bacterium]|nr:HAMP domain-containing protein [Betaproteobacteria bacterium]